MHRPMRAFFVSLVLLAVLSVGFPSSLRAQNASDVFPNRPITIVVPFAAGGPVDFIARTVAQGMSDETGKPIVVENRAGAGGAIGCVAAAHAAPDGYTLLAVDISFVVVPLIRPQTAYDPVKDFRMIGSTTNSTMALALAPGTKADDLKGFIELARREGNISFANAGSGSTPHLAAVSFSQAAKIDPLMVSYRGMSPALNDLVGSQVSAAFLGASNAIGLYQDRKVKLLAVMGNQRLAGTPEVPTFAEQGLVLPGFEQGTWYGLAAPAGTPDAVIETLSASLNRALAKPEVVQRLRPSSIFVQPSKSAEFDDFIRTQVSHWKGLVAAANIKLQE